MENVQQLDQQSLQNLLGDTPGTSGVSLIPESLTSILATAFIVSIGLMVVFLILYSLGIARKWKVQSAVLHMQKDVAEIKQALVAPNSPATPSLSEEPRKVEVTSGE